MNQTSLVRGHIEYVNPDTGCGFIATDTTEKDVLFLRDEVAGSIPKAGQEVTFEIAWTSDGPRAINVRRA